jgi:hypothetical protein
MIMTVESPTGDNNFKTAGSLFSVLRVAVRSAKKCCLTLDAHTIRSHLSRRKGIAKRRFKMKLYHQTTNAEFDPNVLAKKATKAATVLTATVLTGIKKSATGIKKSATGIKKSKLGWKTKKQRKAKRGEKSAIRIQSVVRGKIGRNMARAERREQNATRLQSLGRGVIARDLVKSMKAKEASAVRIQSVARATIVRQNVARAACAANIARDKVRTDNAAATRIQSNQRGYVVRKQQKLDKEAQALEDSKSFFDKFFNMNCSTGSEVLESIEADDLTETHKTATEAPATTEPARVESVESGSCSEEEISMVTDQEDEDRHVSRHWFCAAE